MRWHGRLCFPGDQSFTFQLLQLLDQNLLGDRGNSALQFAVALDSTQQVEQDDRFPVAADFIHDKSYRAGHICLALVFLDGGVCFNGGHTYYRVSTCTKVSTKIVLPHTIKQNKYEN